MEQLVLFSAGSMNDHSHQHLWLKGASLFIPQINKLLEHTNYNFDIVDIEKFENNNSTLLGNILKKINQTNLLVTIIIFYIHSFLIK